MLVLSQAKTPGHRVGSGPDSKIEESVIQGGWCRHEMLFPICLPFPAEGGRDSLGLALFGSDQNERDRTLGEEGLSLGLGKIGTGLPRPGLKRNLELTQAYRQASRS